VDGLILKITNDLISSLERRGLTVKDIKIKMLSRDSRLSGGDFRIYSTASNFYSMSSSILNSNNYLCSAGPFPVIETITLTNNNLPFSNDYVWSNITDARILVKRFELNNQSSTLYEADVERYADVMRSFFDEYTANINSGIRARLNSYVDPCYVDDGYISPN
jgi:hypothetical protein